MGVKAVLISLAAGAPVPVFPVIGQGASEAVHELALDSRVRLVDTPRTASVLLAAGEPAHGLLRPAVRVHDQLSAPRGTLWWPLGAPTGRLHRLFPDMTVLDPGTDVVEAIVQVHREVVRGERRSDPSVLPDVDPAPWRGVGPFGQGGKGMTGGVPYGRVMAGRAPDRDGLELDQLEVRVGPFFPAFPAGLVLHLKLQGDLIQDVHVGENPFRCRPPGGAGALFHSALSHSASIAVLELARARHHLRWLAHMLRVHGLHALGLRTLALARGLETDSVESVRRLGRLLERIRSLGWATAGVGVLPQDVARAAGGPVARAAGISEDIRSQDAGYLALGFEPLATRGGDARARWRQRIAEAVQALELARRAGERQTAVTGQVEWLRGRLTAGGSSGTTLLEALPMVLAGAEWGDAVTTIVSLDLDLEVAA